MIYVGREGAQAKALNEKLGKLTGLCLDLERIRAGVLPVPEQLDDAPLLDNYEFVQRGTLALQGFVTGHPLVGTASVMTSDLHLFAPDLGWARTLSRFYRLGSTSRSVAKWL